METIFFDIEVSPEDRFYNNIIGIHKISFTRNALPSVNMGPPYFTQYKLYLNIFKNIPTLVYYHKTHNIYSCDLNLKHIFTGLF